MAVKSLRRVRRFERSDARALIAGLESKGEVARETEKSLEEGRERLREKVTRGIDAIGREAHEQGVVARRDAEWQERRREREKTLQELVRTNQIRAEDVRTRLALEFPVAPGEVARAMGQGSVPEDALRMRQARQPDGRARERGLNRER